MFLLIFLRLVGDNPRLVCNGLLAKVVEYDNRRVSLEFGWQTFQTKLEKKEVGRNFGFQKHLFQIKVGTKRSNNPFNLTF